MKNTVLADRKSSIFSREATLELALLVRLSVMLIQSAKEQKKSVIKCYQASSSVI